MRLWRKLGPDVAAAVEARASRTIFITGYRKGGAICPLVAWRRRLDYPDHAKVLRAAAPTRVDDRAFAKGYNNAALNHTRCEFDDDMSRTCRWRPLSPRPWARPP